LVVGLVIGAGLVFVSTFIYGGPSAKTIVEASTSVQTQFVTQTVTQTITQTTTITNTTSGPGGGSGSNLYPTTATLVVPTGTSPGTLVITVLNSGNSPVTGIQVALNAGANTGVVDQHGLNCMGSTPAGFQCNDTVAAVCPSAPAASVPAVFCNGENQLVSTANPLSVGSQVSSSVEVTTNGASVLQAGSSYSFTVTIDTAAGSSHIELVSATAEL
jgi:hypothetical protein